MGYEPLVYNTDSIFIGRDAELTNINGGHNGDFFNGWIGRVRLWKHSINQNEICINRVKRYYPYPSVLLADWDMRDNTGAATLRNSVAGGTNGIPYNPPVFISQNQVGDCLTIPGAVYNFGNFRSVVPTKTEAVQIVSSDISLYPNPNKGEFKLQSNTVKASKQTIEVFSSAGKLVYSNTVVFNGKQPQLIQLGNVANGLYLVKITEDKNIHTSKIIVNR